MIDIGSMNREREGVFKAGGEKEGGREKEREKRKGKEIGEEGKNAFDG